MDLESFRNFCLQLPAVSEGFPFGETVLVFKAAGKMFALAETTTFANINLKCDPERAIELRERYPAIIPGYHMNKIHWNTLLMDGSLPGSLIRELTLHSYDLIVASLSKKQRTEHGLDDSPT